MKKSLSYSILFLVLPAFAFAQTSSANVSTSVYEIAFDSALAKLDKSRLAIYTGTEYYNYFIKEESKYARTSMTLAGSRPGEHPFLSNEFRREQIVFDHVGYPAIDLTFDICRSEVVILTPKRKAIVLPAGRVQQFNYNGRTFRLIDHVKGLKSDLYETLYWSDSTSLCVKRNKNQSELWHITSDYYIILNGQAYPISLVSTKSVGVKNIVLRILSDKENEVSDFIRENRLKFRKSRKEQSLKKVVEFYASLKTN